MMKKILVVAAIIINDGKILIAKRKGGDFDGMFEFPGGKIEIGETPEAALSREIKEELDVEIIVKDSFVTIDYDYPTFHLNMECFICALKDTNIKLVDHSAIKWISSNETDIDWIPADIEIIEKLRAEGY